MATSIPYNKIRKAAIETAKQSGLHPAHHYLEMIAGGKAPPTASVAHTAGFVYFIGGDAGPIKIGFATDVAARLSALQTGSPVPLRVLGSKPGNRANEKECHRRFGLHRLHGEWFARHPDILAEIGTCGEPAYRSRTATAEMFQWI